MIVDCLYSYTGYGNVAFTNPNEWPLKIRKNRNEDGTTDF